MTRPNEPTPPSSGKSTQSPHEDDNLDGHTIEELSDYLDRDQTPADPSIDNSSTCQVALASLIRLRQVADTLLDDEAAAAPREDDAWIHRILALIAQEARSGRDIPYGSTGDNGRLEITEGAVRGMIRAAGDILGGILIGRCTLDGDVTVPGTPITIDVEATAFWGQNIPNAVADVRSAIYASLRLHSPLNIVAVNVTIRDMQVPKQRRGTTP